MNAPGRHPVRIGVGDETPRTLGHVTLPGGVENVAVVARFLRALADRMEAEVAPFNDEAQP